MGERGRGRGGGCKAMDTTGNETILGDLDGRRLCSGELPVVSMCALEYGHSLPLCYISPLILKTKYVTRC